MFDRVRIVDGKYANEFAVVVDKVVPSSVNVWFVSHHPELEGNRAICKTSEIKYLI